MTESVYAAFIYSRKIYGLLKGVENRLNNVVLPTLFNAVNNTEQIVEPELACNQVYRYC